MKTSLYYLATLLSFVLLAGCGFVREVHDPIRTYLLEIPEGDVGRKTRVTSEANSLPNLLIGVPQPAPGFESSRMAYVQVPFEVNYFATSQWVESPANMLAPLLVQSLDESGMWQSVIPLPTSIRGDYRLNLTDVVLVQEFLQQPSRLRLTWRGQLVTTRDRAVIGTRIFEREEETISEDAYGGVLAAQLAVKRLLNDLNEWLNGCLHESASAHC